SQHHGGPARAQIDHAHVAPEDALPEPGSKRFCTGLLGGEALGVGRCAAGPGVRFRAFRGCEDTRQEALAVAVERLLDAADVDDVVAQAQDHGGSFARWPTAMPARASSISARMRAIAGCSPPKMASPT